MTNAIRHNSKSHGSLRLGAILFPFVIVLYLMSVAFADPGKIVVYFYSSETNINNFKSLKTEFDQYLSKFGPYEFQPFCDREAFEKQVKEKQKCLLLLSSWHYNLIHKEYSLVPILTGIREGKKYQKRLLVVRDESTIDSIKGRRIASASSVQHTTSVLKMILKQRYDADTFKILTVPKDIDAIMSVGFGMSESALTTRHTFNELKIVNPMLYKKIKVLAEGEESLLLVLAVPEPFVKDAKELIDIIKKISMDPDGKKKLRMLGLDGWQKVEPSDKLKLGG